MSYILKQKLNPRNLRVKMAVQNSTKNYDTCTGSKLRSTKWRKAYVNIALNNSKLISIEKSLFQCAYAVTLSQLQTFYSSSVLHLQVDMKIILF